MYAAGVVTLSGAVVALVVNYRRQRDIETGRFSASFVEAARQLGDNSPAVRIAGVYAIVAVADRYRHRYRHRCQQCIDVLCGYIRLPYNPDAGAGHVTEKSIETTDEGGHTKTVEKQGYRAGDREVRLTIIRAIRDHLRDGAPVSWEGYDFDFTGATFDGGDFSGAVFSGGVVNFLDAVFSDKKLAFSNATFSGGKVIFGRAELHEGTVSFRQAQFSGGTVEINGQVVHSAEEAERALSAPLPPPSAPNTSPSS